MKTFIIADNREKRSGIPDKLVQMGTEVSFSQLFAGDYIINNRIIIERKTNSDFILSIINGRLFAQCAKLRKTDFIPLFIVEGNPFKTGIAVSPEAVKGALLSVTVAWQIPVIKSSGTQDTAALMITAAKQNIDPPFFIKKQGRKPKGNQNKRHYFLGSLPGIGAHLAVNLLEHFGSIEDIVLADIPDLIEVEGIGKKKAEKLYSFFRAK